MHCQRLFSTLALTLLLTVSASAADIAALVQQMDADKFSDRKSATEQLADMGATAIPALKEATASNSREVAMRAFSILERHLADGEEETKQLAKAALEELSAGDGQVSRRAKEVLKPKPAPNQTAQIFGPRRIVIGAPAVARIQIRQAAGNGRRLQVRVANGVKEITVEENGQKVEIRDDPNKGIKVEITEKKDGKEITKKYEAKDAAELKTKHPDAYKHYEKHTKQNGGIQIRAARAVAPAIPQPQRVAQARKDQFDRMKKNLDQQIEKIEKQAQQADEGRKEHYNRMVETLKRHRKLIEDMEQRQLPGQAPAPKAEGKQKKEQPKNPAPDAEKRVGEQSSNAPPADAK